MIGNRDIFWGYLAQVINIGLGLIMLPIIVIFMSDVEVGLWIVFITLISFSQLLDLGFQPTISRNVSYVYAGAQELTAVDVGEIVNTKVNIVLLGNLIAASRRIYRIVSFFSAIILLVFGSLYISILLNDSNELYEKNEIYYAWFLFVIGTVINFYYGYLNAFLQGRGNIAEANKIIVASKSVQIIIGIVMVANGFGLLGLGVASLASTIVSRILANRFVYSESRPEMKNLVSTVDGAKEIMRILWHNSSRFGVVMLGVFLIWRGNVLIASYYLGLAEAASYGIAIQIFFILNAVATVPFNISLPKLNRLRMQSRNSELLELFSFVLVIALLIYSVGAVAFITIGGYVFDMIEGSTVLPDDMILLLMIFTFFLELNHGTCANFLTTENKIPFVYAAVFTGVFIIIGSLILSPFLGMLGLVLSQLIFQLAYNNWKWPREVSILFGRKYIELLAIGFVLLKRLIMKYTKNKIKFLMGA